MRRLGQAVVRKLPQVNGSMSSPRGVNHGADATGTTDQKSRLPPSARQPTPHSARLVTVLSGTVLFGYGERFDALSTTLRRNRVHRTRSRRNSSKPTE